MRIQFSFLAALIGFIQLYPASAGDAVVPSEPVVRGSFASSLSYGDRCLSVPLTEIRAGARLEMRPCRDSADQIFEWNVVSFEIKIRNLCVDALRAGDGASEPGDPVGLWYCQGTQHQKWFPSRDDPKARALDLIAGGSPTGNLCLEILNGSNADGAQLEISACDDSDRQRFRLRSWPVPDSKVSSGKPADGAAAFLEASERVQRGH
jgi:hypothetical protein